MGTKSCGRAVLASQMWSLQMRVSPLAQPLAWNACLSPGLRLVLIGPVSDFLWLTEEGGKGVQVHGRVCPVDTLQSLGATSPWIKTILASPRWRKKTTPAIQYLWTLRRAQPCPQVLPHRNPHVLPAWSDRRVCIQNTRVLILILIFFPRLPTTSCGVGQPQYLLIFTWAGLSSGVFCMASFGAGP